MTPGQQDSEPSGQALPAGTRLVEFVIERVLGSGGFGITYLARDVRLDRQVVIKENLPVQFCFRDTHSLTVAPRHTSGEDAENFQWSLENFSKEAAMLASLDHPGIVKVLRSFEAFGTAYFVMPFVEGLALDELSKQRDGRPFSEEELGGLLERMLAALGYLHDRGIYHRDIKPGNILITSEGIPVLIDFGSARQRLSERSMTVVESAGYTPFEQLQSRGNVGPWSDLYALGGTLVKVMTGETPPKAMDRMRKDPFLPMAERVELKSEFSRRFLQSLDQALAVDEDDRWQDAGEWLAAPRAGSMPDMTANLASDMSIENPSPPAEPARLSEAGGCVWKNVIIVSFSLLGAFVFLIVVGVIIASSNEPMKGIETMPVAAREIPENPIGERKRQQESQPKLTLQGTLAGEQRDFEIAPGVKITMCWIPPGEFLMGSPEEETGRENDETQHWVKLTQGFWLAQTETTQAQWQAVMGNNPSSFKGRGLPVETVSWNDIAGPGGFLEIVNQSSSLKGRFALPTEAQWEYACRAGTTGVYAGNLEQMAWYSKNSNSKTHPVAGKSANAWGLHDVHGNVREWCADWYGAYPDSTETDPKGAVSGSYRVIRGGSWDSYAGYCRVAYRGYGGPAGSGYGVGFRMARSSVP